jgi:hypothetical protein
MTSNVWDPSKTRGFVQVGGAGYNIADLGVETNIQAISGFGSSFESDFGYNDEYLGTRRTSNLERGTGTIESRMTTVNVLRDLTRRNCLINLFVLKGCDAYPSLSNFEDGRIYIDGGVGSTGVSQSLATATDRFDPRQMVTADMSYAVYEEIRPLVHNELASAPTVTTSVTKILSLSKARCPGYCGPDNDGNQEFIAVANPAAPATVATIYYTNDGGLTWSGPDTLSGAANVTSINDATIVGGNVLFALSGTNGGIYSAPLSDVRAGTVVGTLVNGVSSGTNVTAIFAVTPQIVLAGTSTGAILRSRDGGFSFSEIAAGGVFTSSGWLSIHGRNENLVYFAAPSGVLVKLVNQSSFVVIADPSGGDDLTAVHVPQGQSRGSELFVGDDAGDIWYSADAGATFSRKAFTGSGSGRIEDIQSAGVNSIALFVIQSEAGGSSRVLRDLTGGAMGANAVAIGTFAAPANTGFLSIAATSVNHAMVVGAAGFFGKVQAV